MKSPFDQKTGRWIAIPLLGVKAKLMAVAYLEAAANVTWRFALSQSGNQVLSPLSRSAAQRLMHGGFPPRYLTGIESAIGFGYRSCSDRFGSAVYLRPVFVSSTKTHIRSCCSPRCICWHAVLFDGEKSGVREPPSGAGPAFVS